MTRWLMFIVLVTLAGCGAQPTCKPTATRVVTRTETVQVPVVTPRVPPAELLEPLRAKRPALTPLGDYCLTYDAWLELLATIGEFERYYHTCRGFAAPAQ